MRKSRFQDGHKGNKELSAQMSNAGQVKDDGRTDRLKFSKRAEVHLREELSHHARQLCHEEIRAFADCAKASGIWVVWKCKDLSKKMSACTAQYTTDEKLAEWKEKRQAAILREIGEE